MKLLDQQNPGRNIKLVGSIFGALALTGYACLFSVTALNVVDAAGSASWPHTAGRITAAPDGRQVHGLNSPVGLWYEFKVGDRLYRSERVNFFEPGAIEKYLEGQQVSVYYNPATPSDACLVPGIGFMGLLNVCWVGLLLLVGGALLLKLFLSWLRNDNKEPAWSGLAWIAGAFLR